MKCLLKSDEVNLFPIVDVFPIFCILPLISNDMTLHMWHTLVGQTQLQHESSSASWHRKARQIFLAIIDIGLVIEIVVSSILGTIWDWEKFQEKVVVMFAWVFPRVSPNWLISSWDPSPIHTNIDTQNNAYMMNKEGPTYSKLLVYLRVYHIVLQT